jgi:putative ABC transport system permease protein
MVSIIVAFLLFGLLQGIDSAFATIVATGKFDRLFCDGRFRQPLPLAYKSQILAAVRGITRITEVTFVPSYVQDQKNFVGVIATNPDIWLAIRPEYAVDQRAVAAQVETRTGALISDWLAEHNGWKVGDQVTVRSRTQQKNGSSDWTFNIVGTIRNTDFDGENRTMLVNFRYIDEGRLTDSGTANRFLLRIDDPKHSAQVAKQIDASFASSAAPTRTQSEQEQAQAQLSTVGDVHFFTRAVIGAVFFALLFVTANTMVESVRERTAEFAVLKTLGYSDSTVLALVVAEGVLLCLIAAALGLAIAAGLFPFASAFIGIKKLPIEVVLSGFTLAAVLALISTLVPALRARRLSVVSALAVR